jgi:hypothetical protein
MDPGGHLVHSGGWRRRRCQRRDAEEDVERARDGLAVFDAFLLDRLAE